MAVPTDDEKRRAGGAIRVPFVRRCQIDYTSGQTDSAFIVNINVLGAYVAHETMPPLGRTLVFRFHVPGSEREVAADGVVAWTNPQQEHPVHSLPPGFGVAFRALSDDVRGPHRAGRLRLPAPGSRATVRWLTASRLALRERLRTPGGPTCAKSLPRLSHPAREVRRAGTARRWTLKRRQSLTLVLVTAAAVLVAAGVARAENSTAANANFVFFGQVKSDFIGPTASNQYQWYKVRLVPGRSYAAYAWAPDADPSETTVSLDFTWWLDNGTTAAGGVGTSEAEPIPTVTGHNGDLEYIRPTTADCAVASGCTFRLRLAAASAASGFTVNVLVVETTLFSPWWQVGNGYDSAPQIRNNTTSTLSVTYTAYNGAGTVVCTKTASIPEAVIQDEWQHRLLVALRTLSERERDVLGLKFAGGLTNRAIAQLTGLREGHVGVIVYRAVGKLRAQRPRGARFQSRAAPVAHAHEGPGADVAPPRRTRPVRPRLRDSGWVGADLLRIRPERDPLVSVSGGRGSDCFLLPIRQSQDAQGRPRHGEPGAEARGAVLRRADRPVGPGSRVSGAPVAEPLLPGHVVPACP
jgi:RNA polymerase sigma factor (sigma-70 family)